MKFKNISADSKKGSISIGEVEINPSDWCFIAILAALFFPRPTPKELT